MVETKIENGRLTISLPVQVATRSASGKTLIVASTHGSLKTDLKIDGKPLIVGVNAYVKA